LFRFMRDRKVGEGEASDFDRRDGRQRKPVVSHRRARRSHDWTGHHRWSCPHRAAWPASWTVAALCWPWRKTTQIPTGSGSPHHSLFPPLGVHLSSLCILPLPACLLACLPGESAATCLLVCLLACLRSVLLLALLMCFSLLLAFLCCVASVASEIISFVFLLSDEILRIPEIISLLI
jgi:hypothetical protein